MLTVSDWIQKQPGPEARALNAAIAAGVVSPDDDLAGGCLQAWNWLQGQPAAKVPGRNIRKLSVRLVSLMNAAFREELRQRPCPDA